MAYIGTTPIDVRSFGTVKFEFTATSGQTAFTGTDDNNKTLSFVDDQLEVYVNGVLMDNDDFSTSGGNTVTLASAAAANDIITVNTLKSNAPITDYVQTSGGTFTGGINVSSGNVGIGNTSPARKLTVTGSNNTTNFEVTDGSGGSTFNVYNNTTSNVVALGTSSTLMSFGFNGQDKVFFKSDGNVGIGTSSPSDKLHIAGSVGHLKLKSSGAEIEFTRNGPSVLTASDANGYLIFQTGGLNERMRIDSNGNLFVGKTGFGNNTAGHQIEASGLLRVVRANNETAIFNRTSSDGDIITIKKDDSKVGSISVTGTNDLTLYSSASGHKGLRLGEGYYIPTGNAGAAEDATVDIGLSSYRYKSLWLASTAYVTHNADSAGAKLSFQSLHTSNNTIKIHQFGASHANAPRVNQIAVSNAEQHLHLVTDDNATVDAGTSTKGIFLRSGGNVGFGTTSPSSNNGNLTKLIELQSTNNNCITGTTNTAGMNGLLLEGRLSGRSPQPRYAQIGMECDASGNGSIGLYTAASNGYVLESMKVDDNGRVTKVRQPYFKAARSSNYTHSSGDILFNTTSQSYGQNIGGHYSTSTGRFTAPVTGVYTFTACVIWMNVPNGTNMADSFRFRVNGSNMNYSWRRAEYVDGYTGNAGYYTDFASATFKLSANDWVGVLGQKSLDVHGNSQYTYFEGYLLG